MGLLQRISDFHKVKKTIESTKTKKQFENAKKMINFFYQKYTKYDIYESELINQRIKEVVSKQVSVLNDIAKAKEKTL